MNFQQIEKKCVQFMKNNKIKFENNLKYLVNQNNLMNALQDIKNQKRE